MDTQPLKILWRKLLKELASLPRAIAIMALITVLSGLGTVIPQNKVCALCWRDADVEICPQCKSQQTAPQNAHL